MNNYIPNYVDGEIVEIRDFEIVVNMDGTNKVFDKHSYVGTTELKVGQHVVVSHVWKRIVLDSGVYFDREVYEIDDRQVYLRKKESN